MKFVSAYPELRVRLKDGTRIAFSDGEYETDNPKIAQQLQYFPLLLSDGQPVITHEREDTALQRQTWDRDEWNDKMGWRMRPDDITLPDPIPWASVCIIIPVYNAPRLLERCLTTLKQTKYGGLWNVQLVDNASNDKTTIETLRLYDNSSYMFPPIIRLGKPTGFSAAVNAGIRANPNNGYYVLYNQDVAAFDPDWLSYLIRWMDYRKECGLCAPKLLYDGDNGELAGNIENAGIDMANGDMCAERGRGFRDDDHRFNYYQKVATASGAVYCLRASTISRLGMMDERYQWGCEDLEYGLRVSKDIGQEVWYVPTSRLIHSSHAVQESEGKENRERIRKMHDVSSAIYKREWGTYCEHLGGTRVAFILPNFHSACGGARVVGALARQLSICGVRAEVFAREIADDPDTDFPYFAIHPLGELAETDIVVATRFDTLSNAMNVRAQRRVYFVQQIEDIMAASCNGGTPAQALASYRDMRFEILTIGHHLADRLREMGRESTVVDVGFYRALYPHKTRTCRNTRPRVLMYGFGAHKGPDNASVAAAIRRAIPNVAINSFHRFADAPRWSDTHFRPQTTSDVASVYASHDVYVYASESDGFAMTPVEAMACGTPVVITDFPGKDQYAIHNVNCYIAPYRDPAGVAKGVSAICSNNILFDKYTSAGLLTANKYDWSLVGRQYAEYLLEAPHCRDY